MDYSPPGSSAHGISRQEYWSGVPFPTPRHLLDPRVEPVSTVLQADSSPLSHLGNPTKDQKILKKKKNHSEQNAITEMKNKLEGLTAAAAAKSLQSCPTLCDPIDGSPPGAPIPGILQARTLEWVAISFSNAGK